MAGSDDEIQIPFILLIKPQTALKAALLDAELNSLSNCNLSAIFLLHPCQSLQIVIHIDDPQIAAGSRKLIIDMIGHGDFPDTLVDGGLDHALHGCIAIHGISSV